MINSKPKMGQKKIEQKKHKAKKYKTKKQTQKQVKNRAKKTDKKHTNSFITKPINAIKKSSQKTKNRPVHSIEPSGEERAFVYQQAIELAPFVLTQEPIGVILEKKQQGPKYTVTFILIPKIFNIEIQSEGDNLVDVCISAKHKAIQACKELAHRWPSQDRLQQMAHLKKNPWEH